MLKHSGVKANQNEHVWICLAWWLPSKKLRQTDTGSKVIPFYISNIKVILSRPFLLIYFGMIRLFVIYLSYLNIDNLLHIIFAKKFAELK
jgi:hypothetical protein